LQPGKVSFGSRSQFALPAADDRDIPRAGDTRRRLFGDRLVQVSPRRPSAAQRGVRRGYDGGRLRAVKPLERSAMEPSVLAEAQ